MKQGPELEEWIACIRAFLNVDSGKKYEVFISNLEAISLQH